MLGSFHMQSALVPTLCNLLLCKAVLRVLLCLPLLRPAAICTICRLANMHAAPQASVKLLPQEVESEGIQYTTCNPIAVAAGLCRAVLLCVSGIEALLGHSVFIYIYLLSGLAGSSSVLLFSNSPDPISCATAATVGLIGGMVGYELANSEIVKKSLNSRRSKAEDGKQGSSTLRKPWAGVGIVCLMLGLGVLPGSMVDNTAHVGGLLTGLTLGYLMGPRFTLVQEVDIPVGSMMVPDDAPATQVVLDRRSGLERTLVGAGAVGLLAGVLIVGSAAKSALG